MMAPQHNLHKLAWIRHLLARSLLTLGWAMLGCRMESSDYMSAADQGASAEGSVWTQINSSIGLLGQWDYQLADETSLCERMAAKAISPPYVNAVVNFIPTHGFIVATPPSSLEGAAAQNIDGQPVSDRLTWGDKICYRTSETECLKPTATMIRKFQASMARCFMRVLASGRGVSIVPHLDDGQRQGKWRNLHILDPVAENDWECETRSDSYYCALLKPLAQALRSARGSSSRGPIFFAGQGEMGATVFAYPEKYEKALRKVRSIIDPTGQDPRVQVGISINFNKVAGYYPPDKIDLTAWRRLMNSIQFFGVSAYPNLEPDAQGVIDPGQFDQIFDSLYFELQQIGYDLKKEGAHLDLHFSEVGIGGSSDFKSPAQTTKEALTHTWAGIHGPYRPATNPWVYPLTRRAGEQFYCTLGNYLSGKKANRWKVDQAFLWNLATWDIQGLYHASIEGDGKGPRSYRVPSIARGISRYNSTGQYPCGPAGTPP